MIDIGHGAAAVVLVPGLQGRWEWMQPTVELLAEHYRVITYSLCDERSSDCPWDPRRGFENYVRQVDDVLDRAGLEQATLIGVSYGGLIAAEFAARHPERVSNLVLASALPTDWTPDARARFYMRAPRLLSPVLRGHLAHAAAARSAGRLPGLQGPGPLHARARAAGGTRADVGREDGAPHPLGTGSIDFAEPSAVRAPVLVITGEPALDRVVPVAVSERNITLIAGGETRGAAAHGAPWHRHADRRSFQDGRGRVPRIGRVMVDGDRFGTFPAPLGRLEARLELPDGTPRARGGVRASAPAVRRDDAHQGALPGGEGADADRRAPCCASTFAASASAPARSTTARASRTTSRPRSTSWRRASPDCPLWAAGLSFGSWVALTVGAARSARLGADRHRAARGHLLVRRVAKASTKPKFLIHGEETRCASVKTGAQVLRRAVGAEGAGRDRRRGSPVRREDVSDVGDAVEDLLGDFDTGVA